MNNIMSKKKTWLLSIGVTAVVFVIFTAFSQSGKEEEQLQKKEVAAITYPTAPLQFINPIHEISVPAELKPDERVAIYAKITGFVETLLVDRGDQVKKGQLLAVLEAPEMLQQHLSDKSTEQKMHSDYLFAKQAYDRLMEASATSGAVAAIEMDRAKGAMESAKASYEAAKAGAAHSSQLQKYLRITAPFDGVITERNFSVGALAGINSELPLFVMAQDKKLRLIVSLPEKHASSVQEGMKASFTVSSQPGKEFSAELSRTSGLLDQQDRSLKIEFDIDNSSKELQGGDYAQVNLKLQRKDPTYWVSSESLLYTQSGTYIMTLRNNEISRIPVVEGVRMDTLTEVFGGLSPEDSIILKPSEEIQLGQIDNAVQKKQDNLKL